MKLKKELGSPAVRDLVQEAEDRVESLPHETLHESWPSPRDLMGDVFPGENWLKDILNDVERKGAGRPEWLRSEYAQAEIARLRAQAHALSAGYTDWVYLPDSDEEPAEAYINAVGISDICGEIGISIDRWEDVRFVWCEGFRRGRAVAEADYADR